MANYGDIQDKVARRVIDLPSQVTAEVPDLINLALREIQRKHNFWAMEAEATASTVLATRSLTSVPADFKELRGIPYLVEEEGPTSLVHPVSHKNDVYGLVNETATGRPLVLLQVASGVAGARTLSVYPLPDGYSDYTDGEYRLFLPYWKYLPALVSDGDENWFTEETEEYLVFRATAEAFDLNHDDEDFTKNIAKAEAKFREARTRDKLSRLAGADTLVPRWQGVRQQAVVRR